MEPKSAKILSEKTFITQAQLYSDGLYYQHIDIVLAFQTDNISPSVIQVFSEVCDNLCQVIYLGSVNQSLFTLYLCVPKGNENPARTIQQAIKQLFSTIKQRSKVAYKMVLTSKIGISVVEFDSHSIHSAVTHAFQATMGQDRKANQRVSFFDSKLQLKIKRQLLLEDLVRVAIENEEVDVVYQPIVNCRTGKIRGYEILSRFRCDPVLNINMIELLEAAEDINLISDLDLLTYQNSLVELEEVIRNDSLFLNINISTNTRQDFSELFDCINLLTKQHHLDHSRLVLDINPTRDSFERCLEHIDKLTNLGVLTSLADLSPGFDMGSSLADGKFHFLRLGELFFRKFHTEDEYYQVVKLLVQLCHDLNVKVIIQDVATIERARVLLFLGVDYLQGKVFSMPVSVSELGQIPEKISAVVELILNHAPQMAEERAEPLVRSIGSLIHHDIPFLEPGDPVSLANEYFKMQSVIALPVVLNRQCVGIIDQARLNLYLTPTMGTKLETETDARIWHRPVNFIMNVKFYSVESSLDIQSLLKLIKQKNYQLPLVVTKRGSYLGVLTERDLMDYLMREVT